MDKSKAAMGVACLGLLLGMTACDEPPGSATGPATSSARPQSRVVFEAAYSRGGQFRVNENAAGILTMAITGSDGQDNPDEISRRWHPGSLVATYQALLPGAQVPDALRSLESRFLQQLATKRNGGNAKPESSTSGAVAAGATDAVHAKYVSIDEVNFRRNFCRTRDDGNLYAYFELCQYHHQVEKLCYFGDYPQGSYGKNDSFFSSASLYSPDSLITLQPRQWSLISWFNPGIVCLDYEGPLGSGGLTRHIIEIKN